jgi:UDP-N-acetylmuramyl tripeptide synthase
VDIAGNGDVILLCGKGHEKYELGIGGYRELDESEIVCDRVKDILRHDKMQKSKGIDKNEG